LRLFSFGGYYRLALAALALAALALVVYGAIECPPAEGKFIPFTPLISCVPHDLEGRDFTAENLQFTLECDRSLKNSIERHVHLF